jgi:hypothetical protein
MIAALGLASLSCLAIWWGSKQAVFRLKVFNFLARKWLSVFFLFASAFSPILLLICWQNKALFFRLAPILLFSWLLGLIFICFQNYAYPQTKLFYQKLISFLDRRNFLFWLALALCIPLLFTAALKNTLPLGFAGMYSLMAEMIEKNSFRLPDAVPFYGPGGVPFSYPPLGLYLMAALLRLGVSSWTYLRYAPAVFSLLAMIPLFLLATKQSRSKIAGIVAAILASGSIYLFYMQTTSGGMVRGLAFGLGLWSVYCLDLFMSSHKWRFAILAGIFFGLTTLTHLGYAFYFAIWLFAWTITHPRLRNWEGAGILAGVAAVTALPWVLLMSHRYGISIFLYAFNSHGAGSSLASLQAPQIFLKSYVNNLAAVLSEPLLFITIFVGALYLLKEKKFTLPLLFFLIPFYGTERLVLTVGFLIAAHLVASIYKFISQSKPLQNIPCGKILLGLSLMLIFTPFYLRSIQLLGTQTPILERELIDLGDYLKNNSATKETYLFLSSDANEKEEWLPYLSAREPLIGFWGSEWIGTSSLEGKLRDDVFICITEQDLGCIDIFLKNNDFAPKFIITDDTLPQIAHSIEQSPDWSKNYENSRYTLWEHD